MYVCCEHNSTISVQRGQIWLSYSFDKWMTDILMQGQTLIINAIIVVEADIPQVLHEFCWNIDFCHFYTHREYDNYGIFPF